MRKRQLHRPGDLRERIERGNRVSVFHPRKVAAQQAGALLDVTLGHSFLQTEATDCLTNIHTVHARIRAKESLHSNQSSTLWQGKNYDSRNNSFLTQSFTLASHRRKTFPLSHDHFFNVPSRNAMVLFHASLASAARYPSLLFGFSNAWPASG